MKNNSSDQEYNSVIPKRKSKFDIVDNNLIQNPNTNQTSNQQINAEHIPVGILANIVKSQRKKQKENKLALQPYTPLEIYADSLPNISLTELPSSQALLKIEEFYKFYHKFDKK